MNGRTLLAAVCVVGCLVGLSGCWVRVDKHANSGEGKDVSINTPFGNMQVHKNSSGAAAMGLPLYPGAQPRKDNGDDKSVNLSMGFGHWQLHVQAANYHAGDPQNQVESFYRKALGAYGTVITCLGNQPVGEPTRTAEGLNCSDNNDHGHGIHIDKEHELLLKAGSPHHQWLVAFKQDGGTGTDYSLVELTLPRSNEEGGEE